uniref:Uncharacterized protein n=1 Tax=Anopheles atroparvus TaxID=41427 RepID=A0A182ISS3_ANOAO
MPSEEVREGASPDALESQLVSAFRAAALPDTETLDLRQPPSPLSPGSDPHGHLHQQQQQQQQQHHHHHHHHHQAPPPLSHVDYTRKRTHRHGADLPGFFPGGELTGSPSGGKKAKFSAAAAAAAAANYYDNAYLSFEKSLRGAFGAGAPDGALDGPGGLAMVGLDPYGGGGGSGGTGHHHLLAPINYTLTAEAINRRIRSTLGLDDPLDPLGKGTPPDAGEGCCPGGQGVPSPDWLVGRRPALADTRPYTHSPLPPPGTYEEHKFSPFPPAGNTAGITLHDDNNNVDKKTFVE